MKNISGKIYQLWKGFAKKLYQYYPTADNKIHGILIVQTYPILKLSLYTV